MFQRQNTKDTNHANDVMNKISRENERFLPFFLQVSELFSIFASSNLSKQLEQFGVATCEGGIFRLSCS